MHNAAQQEISEKESEPCMICGEDVSAHQNMASPVLCAYCEQTADLPLSSYFLSQFYFRYAD